MDERVVIHLFQDLPGADCGDEPGVLRDKLDEVGRVWFQVKRSATRQDDRGQEKGNQRRKEQVFFMGLGRGCLGEAESELGEFSLREATFCSRASREAKFRRSQAQIRFRYSSITFVLMRESWLIRKDSFKAAWAFFKWHTAKR